MCDLQALPINFSTYLGTTLTVYTFKDIMGVVMIIRKWSQEALMAGLTLALEGYGSLATLLLIHELLLLRFCCIQGCRMSENNK